MKLPNRLARFSRGGRPSVAENHPRLSDSELENLIIGWLAKKLQIPVQEINAHTPLSSLGLDSLSTVELSGSIEEWTKETIDPWIAWEQVDIAELVQAALHPERVSRIDMDG